MENLIRQTRSRYSGAGQANKESSSAKEIRVPPQESQSYKGGKKRSQSWLRRQFSKMNLDYDYSDDELEYPAAIAAAAFAVHSLEEWRIWDQSNQRAYDLVDTPPGTTQGRRKRSVSFSDEIQTTGSNDQDVMEPISSPTSGFPSPVLRKKPTFDDTQPEIMVPRKADEPYIPREPTRTRSNTAERVVPTRTSSKKPENVAPMLEPSLPRQPTTRRGETNRQFPARQGDTMADSWEKEKMAKIEEKYEKLRIRIQTWETNKKEKAKRRLKMTENELSDKKRTKAIERYRNDIARIDEIAAGAREQARENRRNDEFKAKAKANKIRATGKLPSKCLCF